MFRTFLFMTAASLSMSAPSATQPAETTAVSTQAVSARTPAGMAVDWSISPSSRDGQVQLRLSYSTDRGNSNNSDNRPVSELRGLDLRASGPVSFQIAEEAGALQCTGVMQDMRGGGVCRFSPDARFAA